MKKSNRSFFVVLFSALILFFLLSGACFAKVYEQEPNNTQSSSTVIQVGDQVVSTLWHALDYDWYSVYIATPGIVSITAYFDPPGDQKIEESLFLELRNSSNRVVSDFFIDYQTLDKPFIRDFHVPTPDTYYIVAHCPEKENYRRDRYYLTFSQGSVETAKVTLAANSDPVAITANEQSTATFTATVIDDTGSPVVGAPVDYHIAFGDMVNGSSRELVFSSQENGDVLGDNFTTKTFFQQLGEKELTFSYTNLQAFQQTDNSWLDPIPSYFSVHLVNLQTGEKIYLYSTTEDKVSEAKVSKNVEADGNYYLEVDVSAGIWEVRLKDTDVDTIGEKYSTVVTNSEGKAIYNYISTDKKGVFTMTAIVGPSSDSLVFTQTADSPANINIIDLVGDDEKLYTNREYSLNVTVTDKNNNLVEDGTEVHLASSTGTSRSKRITITDQTVKTENGTAEFIISAPTAGHYTLTAQVDTLTDTLSLEFDAINFFDLNAKPPYVLANGTDQSILSVRLNDINGIAIESEPVKFTTTGGTLLNNTTITDEKGIAQVLLVAPFTPGSCTVTALYGTATLSTNIEFYGDGTGSSTASIEFEAEKATLPANGKSSTMLTATLKNSAGAEVPAGTPVTFETDQGTFPNGSSTYNVATPDGGSVTVSLVSSTTPGIVNLTCASGGIIQSLQITFSEVDDDGTSTDNKTASILLDSETKSIPANGSSSATIKATLKNSAGEPVPAGTLATFNTTHGFFADGERSYTVTVPEGGVVEVSLRSTTTPAEANVTCTSGGVVQSIQISFAESGSETTETAYITLSADPENIPANGQSSLTITAALYDSTGQPVTQGTQAIFYASNGAFLNGMGQYTVSTADDSGKVIVSLISSTASGPVDITCYSNGVWQLTTVNFTGSETGIGATTSIELSASPETIPADGASSSTITITLKDNTGQPVVQGTSVSLSTTLGTLSSTTISTVDDSGEISVALTSGIEPGSAKVLCTSNNISQLITVIFTGEGSADKVPAHLSLSLSQLFVRSDNSDSTTVTATVLDENFAVIPELTVTFTANGGQLSGSQVETAENGQANVSFSSGTTDKSNRVVTITASTAGLDARTIPVQITGSTLTLNIDNANLILNDPATQEDESNEAVLTITAEDAGGNAVYATPITITAAAGNSGTIAWSPNQTEYTTDINGQVEITVKGLSAGKAALNITGLGETTTQSFDIAIITESFGIVLPENELNRFFTRGVHDLAITGPSTAIAFQNTNPDTIVRSDGTSFILENYQNGDQIMVGGSLTNDGIYTIASVEADTLTLEASNSLSTETAGETVTITNSAIVRVRAPNQTQVTFSTSAGTFDGGSEYVKTVNVVDDYASVVVSSEEASMATVQVSDASAPDTMDRIGIAFSRPDLDAASLTLQSNTMIIPTSIGDNKSVAYLTAFVKTSTATGSQAVAGLPVLFTITDSTGSGENLSTVIAYTDEAGKAETVFTAGSQSSGAEGVTIHARVVDSAATGSLTNVFAFNKTFNQVSRNDGGSFINDGFREGQQINIDGSTFNDGYFTLAAVTNNTLTLQNAESLSDEGTSQKPITITALIHSVNIVVGGTSGSVVIGRGTIGALQSVSSTTYALDMSVLVADLNGNPVPGAQVSLSLWPDHYLTGVWYILRDAMCVAIGYDQYVSGGPFPNEDQNENTILDAGEDTNLDGALTPPNSAAGDIPTLLTTDANGIANFQLFYLKSSAMWIMSRITATTMVFGTETTASLTFTLPASIEDVNLGGLPDSPYPLSLSAPSGGASSELLLQPFLGGGTFSSSLGNGIIRVDAGRSYYHYEDTANSPAGTIYYDFITVSSGCENAIFPVRVIIQ